MIVRHRGTVPRRRVRFLAAAPAARHAFSAEIKSATGLSEGIATAQTYRNSAEWCDATAARASLSHVPLPFFLAPAAPAVMRLFFLHAEGEAPPRRDATYCPVPCRNCSSGPAARLLKELFTKKDLKRPLSL